VRKDRRKRGIMPNLPPVSERPQVLEEYKDVLETIKTKKNTTYCVLQ